MSEPFFTAEDFPVAKMKVLPPLSYYHSEIANAKVAPLLQRCELLKSDNKSLQAHYQHVCNNNTKLRELLAIARKELKCECPKWVEIPCLSCDAALQGEK